MHFVTCSHYLKFLEYVTLKDACAQDVKIYLDKKSCMYKAIEDKFHTILHVELKTVRWSLQLESAVIYRSVHLEI